MLNIKYVRYAIYARWLHMCNTTHMHKELVTFLNSCQISITFSVLVLLLATLGTTQTD